MYFKGKVKSIECRLVKDSAHWCIDIWFKDGELDQAVCIEIENHVIRCVGLSNDPRNHYLTIVTTSKDQCDAIMRWLIGFLAKYLGRDQELRAYIEFEL